MIKRYQVLIIISFIVITSLNNKKSEAADLSLGITSYYVFYEPYWQKIYSDFKIEPAFLTGPIVNLSFCDNWNLSFLFVYSIKQFSASYTDSGTHIPGASADTGDYYIKYRSDVARYDASLALGYSFKKYYRIFGGIKSAYTLTENEINIKESSNVTNVNSSFNYNSSNTPLGLALGGGFSIPVSESMYISANGSLLYSVSELRITTVETIERPDIDENKLYDYHGYGGNATLQLSYPVSSINTTFSLGGRYEILYMIADAADPFGVSGESDRYYGIIFSAIYTFQL